MNESDIVVHFVTSDHTDEILSIKHPRFAPYLVMSNNLIYLFVKLDTVIMATIVPDLGSFHLKRSLVNKDIEYRCFSTR